jgi:hypothetical protein
MVFNAVTRSKIIQPANAQLITITQPRILPTAQFCSPQVLAWTRQPGIPVQGCKAARAHYGTISQQAEQLMAAKMLGPKGNQPQPLSRLSATMNF